MAIMLLLHILPGVKSFEDLCTLHRGTENSHECDTFAEAAVARGLMTDDRTWERVMDQVGSHFSNNSLI